MDYIDFNKFQKIIDAAFGSGSRSSRQQRKAAELMRQVKTARFKHEDSDQSSNFYYYTDPGSGKIYIKGSSNSFSPVEQSSWKPFEDHPEWYQPYQMDVGDFEFN